MSKKKKQQLENVPVDKMEKFMQENFKKILAVVGALIVVAIAGYGIMNVMDRSELSSYDALGQREIAGLRTPEQIEEYRMLAGEVKSQQDYIQYQVATNYYANGDIDTAKAELAKVGGAYKVFAESLLYDLEGGKGEISQAQLDGPLSYVWKYRAAINAETPEDRTAAVFLLSIARPDSSLLAQLNKWGWGI